ncbi:butyrophilin-like protein 9 isoform X3 [Dromiciops gliroides]|uniref:butyrophilin-like protein 9 isoform X3 n=1 Tax=Dromiciops gliroides TaxID=33562 RepID=UPI001CC65276|nr:butyrophilin-like protein 9 isoform X3 [Dromiciops gliroides]
MVGIPAFSHSSQSSSLSICLFLLLYLLELNAEEEKVIGHREPILAMVGEEVEFPCYLPSKLDAEDMAILFFRNKVSEIVFKYQDRQEVLDNQMEEYRDRAHLIKDYIQEGSVALRLFHIIPADEGQYGCLFQSKDFSNNATWELEVADVFLPKDSSWRAAFIGTIMGLAIILALFMILTFYFFQKQRKSKEKLKKKSEKEKGKLTAELGKLQTEIDWRRAEGQAEWRAARRYAVTITLDPDTAHPSLKVSEDGKSVIYWNIKQDLPNDPKRFEDQLCVLGQEGFISGKHYWEVEVGEKSRWFLGVCYDFVERKKEVKLCPGTGYWVIGLWNGCEYFIFNPHRVSLTLRVPPRQVGVFLNYEAGKVSFFNVTDNSHIFTFTDKFSGTLRPYFRPRCHDGGKQVIPLTVCPLPNKGDGIAVKDDDDCDTWLQPYDLSESTENEW